MGFVVDLLVIVPDWVFTLIAEFSTSDVGIMSNAIGLFRVVRLARLVRLMRVLKLNKLLHGLEDLVDSEYLNIVMNIVKKIILLLMITHIIACIWFGIGTGKTSHSWVIEQKLENAHWLEQYAVSFHWAITQFTPASMRVQPVDNGERGYAIGVVVFALVGFAYVVGSITGSLTQLRGMKESESKQFWTVRRFFRSWRIELDLSHRILRFLGYAWQMKQEQIGASDVPLFALLSEQLHCELLCAISVPQLSICPIIESICQKSRVTINRLANLALSRKHFARNDRVFTQTENATHMDLVVRGRLHYERCGSQGEEVNEWVDCGEDWIAEPILWTPRWSHRGQLVAEVESELLRVSPAKFADCCFLIPLVHEYVSGYASKYVQWLNSADNDALTDITQGEDLLFIAQLRGFMASYDSEASAKH